MIVTSLAVATDRRAAMTEHMAVLGLAFSFFDAIDGRGMTDKRIAYYNPQPYLAEFLRPLSPGEIGCVASFETVCRMIAEGSEEFVCVAEDDALFTTDTLPFLERAYLERLPAFDMLRLGGDHGKSRWGVTLEDYGDRALTIAFSNYICGVVQVMTRQGAVKAARSLVPIKAALDHTLFRDPRTELATLTIRPMPAGLMPFPSTIDMMGGRAYRFVSLKPLTWLRRNFYHMWRRMLIGPYFVKVWGWRMLLRLRPYRH